MTELAAFGGIVAFVLAAFAMLVAAQVKGRRADYEDTGHWDNSKRQKWCEWLRKDK